MKPPPHHPTQPAKARARLYRHTECLRIALHGRDADTHDHCDRVVSWSIEVGRRCGLAQSELDILGIAAQLHDIGKIGVPDRILHKPGKLDQAERRRMQDHSAFGQRICDAVPDPDFIEIGRLVRHHHEAFDGSGYPDGLRGEAIPLGARIIAVCDCYDALVSARAYRAPRQSRHALAIMEQENGSQFDPFLFDQFVKVLA